MSSLGVFIVIWLGASILASTDVRNHYDEDI